jgi:hypothetical protein
MFSFSPDGSGNPFLWFCPTELVEVQNHKKDCNVQQENGLLKCPNVLLLKNIIRKYKIKKLLPKESSFSILLFIDYFFFKNVSTSSGDMIDSTKV